ncbi:lipid-A-disaccharide synthase [Aquabacterium sp. J223]|uniref:lipid-A-disaccharide synthase n=1 Tax=Aquabacterium sp. J223 TaxID=2898431 RepID=UPI0021ADBA0C|nr:lipid-A-disaccharide synthase [Aquabacterium sp. J223]UUX97821.1 lipid-A-disaccharide synthase [Aquabacterium sp. J223]
MRLAMVAGETSGDLLAGLLLGGLKARWPEAVTHGIGGPRMAAHGFDAWWPYQHLAVRGYVEVLRHYRGISRIREQLAERLLRERPDAFIGVDAPDFNLGLETRLRAAGLKTVHFVCPSIWAWRGKRVTRLQAAADLVLCLFPFEPDLLARHGVNARYVGHPLADAIPVQRPLGPARAALGLGDDATVVALLPGSRRSEIEAIAPVFLQAAAELQRRRPALQVVLPVVPGLRALVEPLQARWAPAVRLLDGQSHEALAACDVALVASGTATLEAALFKRPMVIGYRMNPLTWALMKRMAYQPWFGLPNILCRDFVVPELIQERMTPARLADEALAWLDDAPRAAAVEHRFTELHHTLRRDTARQATDAIAQVLGR